MRADYNHLSQEQLAERLDVSIATLKTWEQETCGPKPQTLNGETVYALYDVLEHELQDGHMTNIVGS